MQLFKKKGIHYVGIDLGTASIKLVELAKDTSGQPKLITYGIAESSGDIVRSNAPEVVNKVIGLLAKLKERSGVTTENAIAALPPFSVFSSILSLPPMPKGDLAQAVKWEAKKFVPMPIEEMILDWKLLKALPGEGGGEAMDVDSVETPTLMGNKRDSTSNFEAVQGEGQNNKEKAMEKLKNATKEKKQNYRVLITAAPKNLVSRYIDIFKQAGFKLISLETEGFALARSLLFGNKLPVMVIDIGSLATAISIVEDGIPILNRSLDVGGTTLTNAIAASLNINSARAEQFKRDIGVARGSASGSIPKVIEQTLNPILNEVKYSLSLYQSQTSHSVEKIVLVGGSSLLPSLSEYLSSVLNLNVYLGDPWFRISYPEELKVVLDEVGSRLAVAAGLAMRDME